MYLTKRCMPNCGSTSTNRWTWSGRISKAMTSARYLAAALCINPSNRFSTPPARTLRSEEHTSELQSRLHLVCRLLLEKKIYEMAGQRMQATPQCPPGSTIAPLLHVVRDDSDQQIATNPTRWFVAMLIATGES